MTAAQRRIVAFIIIGGIGTTIGWLMLEAGTALGLSQSSAGCGGYVVASAFGYWAHSQFTFDTVMSRDVFRRYIHGNALLFMGNWAFVRFVLERFMLSNIVVTLVSASVSAWISYFLHKHYTYGRL